MPVIKKRITDTDRLDFLILRQATVPTETLTGWTMQAKAGAVVRTFTGATPRLCIDNAFKAIAPKKQYVYTLPKRSLVSR